MDSGNTNEELGDVLLLSEPPFDPNNPRQFDDAMSAMTLRHQYTLYDGAPHGVYIVKDGQGRKALFTFCQGDDAYEALSAVRQASMSRAESLVRQDSQGSRSLSQSSQMATEERARQTELTSMPSISAAQSAFGGSRPQAVLARMPRDMRQPIHRSQINEADRNSLQPLDTAVPGAEYRFVDLHYCLKLQIDGEAYKGAYVNLSECDYIFPVDTGDAPVWFYGNPYTGYLKYYNDDNDIVEPTWPRRGSESDWDQEYHKKLWFYHGPDDEVREERLYEYADGGVVSLRRWGSDYDIPIALPAWDWYNNQAGKSYLKLPRIIAHAANKKIVRQPYAGNLGLGVPGWTGSFNPEISSGEMATFGEAVRRSNNHVETPTSMMIRLVHPLKAEKCGERAASFLYFGRYWPCGVVYPESSHDIYVPRLGDKIRIFPYGRDGLPADILGDSAAQRSLKSTQYKQWTVRLVSMTLLKPKTDTADSLSTSEDEWEHIHIGMPNMTSADTPSTDRQKHRGICMILDSCSSLSSFPLEIHNTIKTSWLGLDAGASEILIPEGNDLDRQDIIFKFLGSNGREVDFRCTASRFLKAPWTDRATGLHRCMLRPTAHGPFVLGQNFYWTAFIRHDCTTTKRHPSPQDTPAFIQLAAQRVAGTSGHMSRYEEEHILLHKGMPGRLANARRQLGSELRFP